MTTLRCTQRLAKRFGLCLENDPPASSGVLGDWYANLLNVGRQRLVLCVSERSLIPVIVPARKGEFPARFAEHLAEVLEAIDMPRQAVESEAEAASEVVFAKTKNRQVLGIMADFIVVGSHYLSRGRSPLETCLMLARMPCKPIGYDHPERVVRGLFDGVGP